MLGAVAPVDASRDLALTEADIEAHLLISEIVTGGASASDEFIELYNPGVDALPLEGLELVYVTASGLTVSRRASWSVGAPSVPPGGHQLIANEAGIFTSIADARYATGIAATGGSVALRIQGAASPIDAIGWGSATSSWLEGTAAPAPAAGSSLERLPGGAAGSGQDTDDNALDFRLQLVPDPQNSTSATVPDPAGSPAPSATAVATPSPSATPEPTAVPTPTPTPTPGPTATSIPSPTPSASITIAEARSLPDGSTATISGVALTSSAFSEGGGYLTDGETGIAVLLSDGSFARSAVVTVRGTIDDRYAQRTLRAAATDLAVIGSGADPSPLVVTTAEVDESVEGQLIQLSGTILGVPTALSTGLAFDVDDGSGPVRVLVTTGSNIDTAAWVTGARLDLVGVVGQRDATGTGTTGYRVQPRDTADILATLPPAMPTPSATPSPTPVSTATPLATPTATPAATPVPGDGLPVVSVAAAREMETGARLRIRAVVTAGSGLPDAGSAVVQDASAAILVRLGDDAGRLTRGEFVELSGTRSTKSGMLTLRATQAPVRLSPQPAPDPQRRITGAIGEPDEARLVVVRGALTGPPRRSSANNTSFDIDDGSGEVRVIVLASSGASVDGLVEGAWIELRAIVGQETTGAQPERGYRLWPRDSGDVRVLAAPVETGEPGASDADSDPGGPLQTYATATSDRGAGVGGGALTALLPGASPSAAADGVEATLVVGAWPELDLAGVVWDGVQALGLDDAPGARRRVQLVLGSGGLPATVRVHAAPAAERHAETGLALLDIAGENEIVRVIGTVAPPLSTLPPDGRSAWVRLSGLLRREGSRVSIDSAGVDLPVETRCAGSAATAALASGEAVVAEGLALGDPVRLVVGCAGLNPAPSLAFTTGASGVDPVSASIPPVTPVPALESDRRIVAVGVLLVALIGLAGVGLLAWRSGALDQWLGRSSREQDDGDERGGGDADEATSAELAAEEESGASPRPRLSVVQVPHERGSP